MFNMVEEAAATIVVLLPGLWMPAWVMLYLQRQLERAGFRCVRFGYRSARSPLAQNAARLAAFVQRLGEARVHLVGHSLGGVLALHATSAYGLRNVQRIVLIGSPWRDSYVARKLLRYAIGRWMLGKTVPDWLHCEKAAVPPGAEVGVLAGTLEAGLGMVVAPELRGPHDGVIRADETPVAGMASYAEARVSHAGMLVSRTVGQLVGRFLAQGRFEAAGEPSAVPADEALAYRAGREP
jgi:pimeloyl-ACP methyl ester carboxylesterase